MAYFDIEDSVRNIGQLQYKALTNLWDQPAPELQMSSAMLAPQDSNFGPFGQALAQADPTPYSLPAAEDSASWMQNPDPYGQQAMADVNSLKNQAAGASAVFEMGKQIATQKAFAAAAAKEAERNGTAAPSSGVTGATYRPGGNPLAKPITNSPYNSDGSGASGGYFPYADVVKGYIPDDLKNDPELMHIIAAGAKAESGWDPRAVNPNGGATGLWQFHPKGMGAGATQAQLMDPAWQAQRIVPQYVDAYRRRAQSGQSDPAQIAAWVAGQVERPEGYQTPGSASWNNYASAYSKVGQSAQNPAPANSGAPYQVNRTSQFGLGLNKQEAEAFCGPAAALALASFYGNNIPVETVRQYATQVGWNSSKGMAGAQSEANLLGKMGVNAQVEGWNDYRAQQLLSSGTPVVIDTPGHYFVADRYDPQHGYHVGTSGTDLRQGGEWLTPQQMAGIGVAGAPRSMVFRRG